MGFNKKIFKDIDSLISEYTRVGHRDFKRIYSKYDVFMGMTDDHKKFIDKILIKDEKWTAEDQNLFEKFRKIN